MPTNYIVKPGDSLCNIAYMHGLPDCTALRAEAVIAEFKPHPEDSIENVFGLADEDEDENLILALLRRCGCRIPVPHSQEALNMGPVNTVCDLVDYLVRMKSPSPSSG